MALLCVEGSLFDSLLFLSSDIFAGLLSRLIGVELSSEIYKEIANNI